MRVSVFVCVRACVRACVSVCVCVCICVRVYARAHIVCTAFRTAEVVCVRIHVSIVITTHKAAFCNNLRPSVRLFVNMITNKLMDRTS